MQCCKICTKISSNVYCTYSCQEYAWELDYLENKHEDELTHIELNRIEQLGKKIEIKKLNSLK